MLIGILRMPEDMVAGDPLTLHQFIGRARQAATRIESDAKEIESLAAKLAAAQSLLAEIEAQEPVVLSESDEDAIYEQAERSFRQHCRGARGQMFRKGDSLDWHIMHAAFQFSVNRRGRPVPPAAQTVAPAGVDVDALFQHIKHGDADHQAWLLAELRKWFASQQPAAQGVADSYYIACFRHSGQGKALWWGPNFAGYTPYLEQAGVYKEEELHGRRFFEPLSEDVPVPVPFARGLSVSLIDTGHAKSRPFWNAKDLRAALLAAQQEPRHD